MTITKDRPNSKGSSIYSTPFQGGLTDEYIDVTSNPYKVIKEVESEQSSVTRQPSPFSTEEHIDHTDGAAIGSYVSFWFLIEHNPKLPSHKKHGPSVSSLEWEDLIRRLLVSANKKLGQKSENPWQKIMDDVLSVLIVWAVIYFLEKIVMLFIAIHYHYRADGSRIEKSKRIRKALAKLYDASTSVYPFLQGPFTSEDAIIRQSKRSRGLNGTFLAGRGYKNMPSNLIVDHALEESKSSAALARRIWLSLVPEGRETLEVRDLIEVFGPCRKGDAEEVFAVIDENENGDVTLNEMILTVVDVGRTRTAVYQGMTDINRAINVLDWICCLLIFVAIVIYAVIRYVPGLKGLKESAGITALGLTWGLGRTIHEFLNGCIFIFFKHAYDIGDRIEIYNPQSTVPTSVVVTRISILFTIFRRIDNGKDLQMSNDRLNLKRIENVTRSGANKETVPVFVDANTTFTDITYLKHELSSFLTHPSNIRDYKPLCTVRIHSIHELQKLELRVVFTHKSNWANEDLRAARSSKFMCFLVSAIRRIPMVKPMGYGAAALPPRRLEPVRESEEAAFEELTVIPVTSQDPWGKGEQVATGIDIESTAWVGQRVSGLRRRMEAGSLGVPYGPS
ncbi:MAG: hypothetical protein MMC33_005469 [Icmadophila ericetorum]|nr:hypothetical protein [Icmadophila ericetorum]